MLSIAKVGGGSRYYRYLAGAYYIEDGSGLRWSGSGADDLGLHGEATEQAFRRIAAGFAPTGKKPKPLVQNAGMKADPATGKRGHVQGWDLTYSAPKSVSVLWAVARDEVRSVVADCQRDAVADAMAYLEENAAFTRRGKGGKELRKAKLIVAEKEHGTNREEEPQLHSHLVVLNVCIGEDGKTGTLHSPELYRHKMTAGALYRASLAAALSERLKVIIEPEQVGFRITGVPRELCEEWSTRREQVLASLNAFGTSSPQAAATAARVTRTGKEAHTVEAHRPVWQAVAEAFGFGPDKVAAASNRPEVSPASPLAPLLAVSEAHEKLLRSENWYSEQQLIRTTAENAIGRQLDAKQVLGAVSEWVRSEAVIELKSADRERRFTSRSVIAQEAELLRNAESLNKSRSFEVNFFAVVEALDRVFPQSRFNPAHVTEKNQEQRAAVEHLLQPGGLRLLSGFAGTGKSTALRVAREVWEEAGYEVIGAAVAGKAARGLEKSSGIKSNTLASLLAQLDMVEEARTQGKEPYHKWTTIGPKTVIVVDEAGMVASKQMGKLFDHAARAKAKVVLVGDAYQLQPVEAGGPFRHFTKHLKSAELSKVVRQSLDMNDPDPEWKRKAVLEFRDGESEAAFRRYHERGLITFGKDRRLTCEALARDWEKMGGAKSPKESLIFASTNAEVSHLNLLCQQAVTKPTAKDLMGGVRGTEGDVLVPGDRILITKREKKLGLENGDLGTVQGVRGSLGSRLLVVALDDRPEEPVVIPTKDFREFRLGYAMTTHKGQGVTCKNAFVLLGGPMQDRHLTYVQASRAVETTRFYVDRYEAGPGLSRLAVQASRERMKDLATDSQKQPPHEPPGPNAPHFGFEW